MKRTFIQYVIILLAIVQLLSLAIFFSQKMPEYNAQKPYIQDNTDFIRNLGKHALGMARAHI